MIFFFSQPKKIEYAKHSSMDFWGADVLNKMFSQCNIHIYIYIYTYIHNLEDFKRFLCMCVLCLYVLEECVAVRFYYLMF